MWISCPVSHFPLLDVDKFALVLDRGESEFGRIVLGIGGERMLLLLLSPLIPPPPPPLFQIQPNRSRLDVSCIHNLIEFHFDDAFRTPSSPTRKRRRRRRRTAIFLSYSNADNSYSDEEEEEKGKKNNEKGGNRSSSSSYYRPIATDNKMSPYEILGVEPSCTILQLKSAFRDKVKKFHPDVCEDTETSDAMIRLVIRAYEHLLSNYVTSEPQDQLSQRDYFDPFEEPECEAYDIFVNELLCIGKGCPYSCVKAAPDVFSFATELGTAHAISQEHSDDYRVQIAVGQCPRRCIHFVTPAQRVILEELLSSILTPPYDSAEMGCLKSLITRAAYENNRYQKPRSQPKVSNEFVDWY